MTLTFETYLGLHAIQARGRVTTANFLSAFGFSVYNRLRQNLLVKDEEMCIVVTKRGYDALSACGSFRKLHIENHILRWGSNLLAGFVEERRYHNTHRDYKLLLHSLDHMDMPQYAYEMFLLNMDDYEPWVEEQFKVSIRNMSEDDHRDLAEYVVSFAKQSKNAEDFITKAEIYAPPIFFDILTHERMKIVHV